MRDHGKDKIPNHANLICNKRRKHNWKLMVKTYYWEYWDCQDCPATKKVRPKGW